MDPLDEVDLLVTALSPSYESNERRQAICNFVESVVQKLLPGIRLLGSGSFTSRTYLPASDIDLVLFTSAPDESISNNNMGSGSSSSEMQYILQIFQALCIEVSNKDSQSILPIIPGTTGTRTSQQELNSS